MTQLLSFTNQRGEELSALLHGPPSKRIAILCHGMLSTKRGHKHAALADLLAAAGVGSLRFDFAGRGESGGSLFDLTLSRQMEDLDAAVGFLGRRGVQEVVVFGSSLGGAVAYLTAARDERIVAVASLSAVGHPERFCETHPEAFESAMSRGYFETPDGRIGRAFFDDARTHDVVAAVGILHAPVFVVHGELDATVPCSDAHDIATTARNASLELVVGADHEFTQPTHLRPALAHISAFLVTHAQRG